MGSRRAGKTTLLKNTFPTAGYISLDDYDYLDLADRDPKQLISRFLKVTIVDEIQRAPKLLIGIKKFIDDKEGLVYLTSSSSMTLFKTGIESLAGRVKILECPTVCWNENLGPPTGSVFDSKKSISELECKAAMRTLGTWMNLVDIPRLFLARPITNVLRFLRSIGIAFSFENWLR